MASPNRKLYELPSGWIDCNFCEGGGRIDDGIVCCPECDGIGIVELATQETMGA